MSQTIISQPSNWSPIHMVDSTTLYYNVSSTTATFSNYKYIFKINQIDNISGLTTSYSYKVPPRPTTGYGLYAASDILKSYVSYDKNPWIVGFTAAPNSYVTYNMTLGEEYNPGITFSDTVFESGYLGLTFATPHGLLVNDIITIDKTNKQLNPTYDGTASVTQVVNAYEVKTTKPYLSATSLESGSISNLIRMTTSNTATQYAFNGNRQYDEINTDFSSIYKCQAISDKFLTHYDNTKKVFSTDWETLGFILDNATPSNVKMIVTTYNTSGSTIDTSTYSYSVTTGNKMSSVGVGPKNLGLTNSNIDRYEVELFYNTVEISALKSYQIVTNCSVWPTIRIMFLNSLGQFDYWNFNYLSKDTFDIQRNEFKKTLDYNYNVGDRGYTVLSQTIQESLYMSTDWITEYDSAYLVELINSPEVYYIDQTNYLLYPLMIKDTNYEIKTSLKDKLICLSINVKFANNISSASS